MKSTPFMKPVKAKTEEEEDDDEESEDVATDVAAVALTPKLPPPPPANRISFNVEITGEEDEETVHSVRCKLFSWEDDNWKERGTGYLKLNSRHVDGSEQSRLG